MNYVYLCIPWFQAENPPMPFHVLSIMFSITSVCAVFIDAFAFPCRVGGCLWVESTLNARAFKKIDI